MCSTDAVDAAAEKGEEAVEEKPTTDADTVDVMKRAKEGCGKGA